jgi:hypothetical protein
LKTSLLVDAIIAKLSLKKYFFPEFWAYQSLGDQILSGWEAATGAIEERRRPHGHTTSGMVMGQLAKRLGWKEKWMDSDYLAKLSTYPRSLKSYGYDMDILR